MKGNAMRNNINMLLLALLLINSGVGAMVLFGLLKGGLLTLAIIITIYANMGVQERKARKEEETITAYGWLSESVMLNKIYGKYGDNNTNTTADTTTDTSTDQEN